MSKSTVVLGAGPGLGQAVARRFGREGYAVVVVARRREPLAALVEQLEREGAVGYPIAADLSDDRAVLELVERLRSVVGCPDVVYYGPSVRGYVSVVDVTAGDVCESMQLAVYTLVDIVHAFLQAMIERRRGAVLVAAAASAIRGLPQLAGAAALGAQRNYLQALEGGVTDLGIHVGRLYLGGVVEHSAFHERQLAAKAAGKPVLDLPLVSPARLADALWTMQNDRTEHELVCPGDRFKRMSA